MKKLISIILSAVMLLSAVITVNAASFKDVKSSDWFYASVNYVADKGIMKGTSSTKFSPKASLTRAMGVTLLYRVAGSPSVSGVTIPFTDVKSGTWYTDAVKWAYKNGIVTGKSSTYFDTNGNITRAEFATILNRYSDFMKYTLHVYRTDSVIDAGKVPEWAFMAVWKMYCAEIINGRSDGSFDPNAKITRAEAAAMIERFMKAPKDGSGNSNTGTQPPIENPDIPTTGKLVIKEKKYNYADGHVMIFNVENQTSKNLNVTFKATFYDSSGKAIMKQNRMIEGFPANYRNYVVFEPGLKFDKFTYEVETETYSGTTYMQYIVPGSDVKVEARPAIMQQFEKNPDAEIKVDFSINSTYHDELHYIAHFVLFDKNGDIFWIEGGKYSHIITKKNYQQYKTRSLTYYGTPYTDFKLPDNLNGSCSGIIAFKGVYTEQQNV
ncbi:MAG: S-layer homology domain-containing protein [Clostridia bacterium]|nr:S-layer homology domain-containing protein [Clostridia bacterium]